MARIGIIGAGFGGLAMAIKGIEAGQIVVDLRHLLRGLAHCILHR